jgi:uncharacterized membrane protein YuzA (DUF378 family)
MMNKGCLVCMIVAGLVILGALNWGLIGIFGLNLVGKLFGEWSILSRIVYILIGVAGVIKLITCFKACPACNKAP